MIMQQKIKETQTVVRCFNIVSKSTDPKYGQICEQRLIHKNSAGEVAGEIKCRRCGALYEIKDNYLILKENMLCQQDKERLVVAP
jgi:uncharacterized protein YbaR (Trm112 family)